MVLAGASNLTRRAARFSDPTFSYVDTSTPGWTPTPDNISTDADQVEQTVIGGVKAFVFDLFGNIAVRYEQFDGSTTLMFKGLGRFHLAGKIVTYPFVKKSH